MERESVAITVQKKRGEKKEQLHMIFFFLTGVKVHNCHTDESKSKNVKER